MANFDTLQDCRDNRINPFVSEMTYCLREDVSESEVLYNNPRRHQLFAIYDNEQTNLRVYEKLRLKAYADATPWADITTDYSATSVSRVGSKRMLAKSTTSDDFYFFVSAATSQWKVDLEYAIQNSRKLLDLEEDWDGEGSPAYLEATWQKATRFLREFVEPLYNTYGVNVGVPKIGAGPEGSIDLHWKNDQFELLINIPVEGHVAQFYGDDYHENVMEGKLNILKINKGLCVWIDCAHA